ncbi:hypothetical protein [Chryseobacterium viscerum]|uniref:Uncharacterized protein n=1 Tax=Chryseobacterium viscerum TaxID=1037377 RepID=A0A5N4BP18_9FLAO|nr:hypothetical protein [Chryseobacterium viscerum]KAB1230167.1 hypothetical protein F8D52_13350 [Chryseobacterium viscerum]
MKKIIAVSSLVLVLTLFYYPILDDKKISFAVIFLCFVGIIFSAAKLYSPDEKEDYESFEKEMDKLYEDDGIFQYTDNGFYIKQKNTAELIKWNEIVSIHSFIIPSPFNKSQSGLEIITDSKSYEFDDKVTPGIIKLKDQLSSNLPTWELDSPTVRVNNFGLKKTKLYEKKNL